MKNKFAGDKKVGHSILHKFEQKLVKWGTPKIPSYIETYHLTSMTILWSIGALLFGYLAQFNINWLWGTSTMIILQYITDLFDGAVGRYRNTGLIKWGYYADHFLDYIFMSCLLIAYSFFIPDKFGLLFFLMMIYGGFMVNAFIHFAATNEFTISYFGFGPTEGRIGFIAVNSMLIILGKVFLSQFLPILLFLAVIVLIIVVYKNQKLLWNLDMKNKKAQNKN